MRKSQLLTDAEQPILAVRYKYDPGSKLPFTAKLELYLPIDETGYLAPVLRSSDEYIWGCGLGENAGNYSEHGGKNWRKITTEMRGRSWWEIKDIVKERKQGLVRQLAGIVEINKNYLEDKPEDTEEILQVF
ncbi:MAG: hypothetical protein ONB11_12060 [candidate division KSB1 bacterium]|nr:hypothetical protein [candidate division KSB1 bacterium]